MARYKIKKKRSDLKTDVFVETTEDWVKTARAWALPITLGVVAVALIVVFWTWSSRAESERLDKLWGRLAALGQETMWNEDIAGKWDALLADTAGTAVEPHVLLRYAGRLIGEVKTEQLRKAAELLQRLEASNELTPSLIAAAADTRKRLDALLQFKPGEAGSGSAGGKETSSSVQGPEPGAPAANAGPAATAAVGGGGDEPVVPPSGAEGGSVKEGDTKSSSGSGNKSIWKKKESKDAAAEGAAAPASTGASAAGVPPQGAASGAAAPGPATNELPAAEQAAKKREAEEEREQIRKRQKPPP